MYNKCTKLDQTNHCNISYIIFCCTDELSFVYLVYVHVHLNNIQKITFNYIANDIKKKTYARLTAYFRRRRVGTSFSLELSRGSKLRLDRIISSSLLYKAVEEEHIKDILFYYSNSGLNVLNKHIMLSVHCRENVTFKI